MFFTQIRLVAVLKYKININDIARFLYEIEFKIKLKSLSHGTKHVRSQIDKDKLIHTQLNTIGFFIFNCLHPQAYCVRMVAIRVV